MHFAAETWPLFQLATVLLLLALGSSGGGGGFQVASAQRQRNRLCGWNEDNAVERRAGKGPRRDILWETLPDYCGKFDKKTAFRIQGGRSVTARAFPSFVLISFRDSRDRLWECGGTIISQYLVLTSAFCAKDARTAEIRTFYGPSGKLAVYQAYAICRSGRWKINNEEGARTKPKMEYDIAVIKTGTRIEFNDYVEPACLPDKRVSPCDDLQLVGVGDDGLGRRSKGLRGYKKKRRGGAARFLPDYPRVVEMYQRLSPADDSQTTFAVYPDHPANGSACGGDMGGPAYKSYDEKGRQTVYGIMSYISGPECGRAKPGQITVTGLADVFNLKDELREILPACG